MIAIHSRIEKSACTRVIALAGSSGTLAPVNIQGYARDGKVPNIHSYSLGVQRNIGLGTVIDVAYVGTLSRHLVQTRNLNTIPYLTTFQKSAQDPSRFDGPVPDVEPGTTGVREHIEHEERSTAHRGHGLRVGEGTGGVGGVIGALLLPAVLPGDLDLLGQLGRIAVRRLAHRLSRHHSVVLLRHQKTPPDTKGYAAVTSSRSRQRG